MKTSVLLSFAVAIVCCCCCSPASAQNEFVFPDDVVRIPFPQQPPPTAAATAATQAPTTSAPSSSQAPTTTAAPTPTTASPAYLDCLAGCPTTSEYNPVCGSDLVSYNNGQRLVCANLCGPRVNQQWTPVVLLRRGPCIPLG